MSKIVLSDPLIMHGTPCFAGTRVPVAHLFDHLTGGYTVDGFLEQFPSVSREKVMMVLDEASELMKQNAIVVTE